MITFYIIGVVIALLVLLTSLAMMIRTNEVYGLDIIVTMVVMFGLSLFSWTIVLVIGIGFVLELTERDR